MKNAFLFLGLFLTTIQFLQAQFDISGQVIEQNSKFTTGKLVYLSDVEIESNAATAQYSDNNGKFTLNITDDTHDTRKVFSSKPGYRLISMNDRGEAGVDIVMCSLIEFNKNAQLYTKLAKLTSLNSSNKRKEVLKYEGKERQQLIAQMEQETNVTIKSTKQASDLLNYQFEVTQQFADILAIAWSKINLDDQSNTYQLAQRQLRKGNVKEAVDILDKQNLKKLLSSNPPEKDQLIMHGLLKAELHTLLFEFDKAEAAYELGFKHDSDHPQLLYSYTLYSFLKDQHPDLYMTNMKDLPDYPTLTDYGSDYLPYLTENLVALADWQRTLKKNRVAEHVYQAVLSFYKKTKYDNPNIALQDEGRISSRLGGIQYETEQYEKAEKSYLKALKNYKILAENYPENNAFIVSNITCTLGDIYYEKKEYQKAEQHYRDGIASYQQLTGKDKDIYTTKIANTYLKIGSIQTDNDQLDKAKQSNKQSLALYKQLAEKDDELYKENLARIYYELGRLNYISDDYEVAEDYYEKALEIFNDYHETNPNAYIYEIAKTSSDLGNVFYYSKQYEQAETQYQKAINNFQRIEQEENVQYEKVLATIFYRLGRVQSWLDKPDKSIQTLEAYMKMARQFSGKPLKENEARMVQVLAVLANSYNSKRETAKAEALFRECLTMARKLAIDEPKEYSYGISRSASELGVLLYHDKRIPEAEKLLLESASMFDIDEKTSTEITPTAKGNVFYYLGCIEHSREDYTKAIEYLNKALSFYSSTSPNDPERKWSNMGMTQTLIGNAYYYKKDYSTAQRYYQESLAAHQQLIGLNFFEYESKIVDAHKNLGMIHEVKRDIPKAIQAYEKGVSIHKGKKHKNPTNHYTNLAKLYSTLTFLHLTQNEFNKADSYVNKIEETTEKVINSNPIFYLSTLVRIMDDLSRAYYEKDMEEKAEFYAVKAEKYREQFSEYED